MMGPRPPSLRVSRAREINHSALSDDHPSRETHALLCQEDFTREASHSQCCSPACALILLSPARQWSAPTLLCGRLCCGQIAHSRIHRDRRLHSPPDTQKRVLISHFPHYASNDQFSAARNH